MSSECTAFKDEDEVLINDGLEYVVEDYKNINKDGSKYTMIMLRHDG